jgi:hypothetical protein
LGLQIWTSPNNEKPGDIFPLTTNVSQFPKLLSDWAKTELQIFSKQMVVKMKNILFTISQFLFSACKHSINNYTFSWEKNQMISQVKELSDNKLTNKWKI